MTSIDDRVNKILEEVKIIDIFPESNSTHTCPACNKRGKFYQIAGGKLAKCYSSSCIFNNPKNVINSFRWQSGLEQKSDFITAIQELEVKFNISNINLVPQRSKLLEECLDIYQDYLWSSSGKDALNYLINRGFLPDIIKQEKIGYAPHQSCLREYDVDILGLKREGLLVDNKEVFFKRVILPIRNIRGNLVHYTGRYIGEIPKDSKGDDLLGRYKETKSITHIPSSKSLLAFEDRLSNYLKYTDTLVIAEGYLDALSLIQLGIPTVASFGLEKINSHYSKFSKFNNLIFMFDNDTYSNDHPTQPLEYKSWIRILPQLIELQTSLPTINFYTCLVPNMTNNKRTKDINDWVNLGNISSSQAKLYIETNKKELVTTLISKWGGNIENHLSLLRLIKTVNKDGLKEELNKYIDPSTSILDYALNLVSI